MSQINITPPADGDRTGAAGVNLIAVLIGGVVLLALLWFLFTGGFGGSAAPPANPSAPQPTTAAPAEQPTAIVPTVQP